MIQSSFSTIIFVVGALGTTLMVVSAVLVGIGSFLYNDGRDHELVGKMSAGIGGLAFAMSSIAQDQQRANEGVDCLVFDTGCDEYYSLKHALWDGFLRGIVEEMILVFCCGVLGLVVAKLTTRKPADRRSWGVLPPEDD